MKRLLRDKPTQRIDTAQVVYSNVQCPPSTCMLSPKVLSLGPLRGGDAILIAQGSLSSPSWKVCFCYLSPLTSPLTLGGNHNNNHNEYKYSTDRDMVVINDDIHFTYMNVNHRPSLGGPSLSESSENSLQVWRLSPPPPPAASITCYIDPATKVIAHQIRPSFQRRLALHLRKSIVLEGSRCVLWDRDVAVVIIRTVPSDSILTITKDTKISVQYDADIITSTGAGDKELSYPKSTASPSVSRGPSPLTFPLTDDTPLAALDEPLALLRETLLLPLKLPPHLHGMGIECPKGILLHGPPGTGKTMVVRRVAGEVARQRALQVFVLDGASLYNGESGETERKLREIFAAATHHASSEPSGGAISIIFMDEIDALCPKREGGSVVEARVVAQLLTLMDGMTNRGQVIIIAATNRPNEIDPALRRPGRFDREINIGPPTVVARREILKVLLSKSVVEEAIRGGEGGGYEEFVGILAERTVGYVGADLVGLLREATLLAINNKHPAITKSDFESALSLISPSSLRGYSTDAKPSSWASIGGLEQVKMRLQQAVEWPIKHAASFKTLGLKAPKGMLLYGPPGCSKTTLVSAVAHASSASFFSLAGADVYSPWVGDAEKAVRDVFKRARAALPAVIFLDEIDAMVGNRDGGGAGEEGGSSIQARILSTLLNEMDGIETADGLLVIAATNRPRLLDAALLRPGRLETLIYVPLPDYDACVDILKVHCRNVPLGNDVDLREIAHHCECLTGAEIESVVREAVLLSLRSSMGTREVDMQYFLEAAAMTRPSVSNEAIEDFVSFQIKS